MLINMFKRNLIAAAVTFSVSAFSPTPATAVAHLVKTVSRIQTADNRDCFFFQLSGVSISDPAVTPTSDWFAIPRTHVGYRDLVQMVTMAKLTQNPIDVYTTGVIPVTTGGVSCGLAGVLLISTP
jgi:hypothetical protein